MIGFDQGFLARTRLGSRLQRHVMLVLVSTPQKLLVKFRGVEDMWHQLAH